MKFINKDLIQNGIKHAVNFTRKNAPHFLTGTAIFGVGLTSFFAVKGVIKAKDIIELEKNRRKEKLINDCKQSDMYPENGNVPPLELIEEQVALSKKEIVKMTWKVLLPMIISGATTISCIIGSDVINTGRNAALLAVASASEKALEKYQNKNVELFGEKNHQKILDEEAKDDVQNVDISNEDYIANTGTGNMLILDAWCGMRPFRGSRDAIDKTVNSLNLNMYQSGSLFDDGFTSLNDFYLAIGIQDECQCGEDLGWNKLYPIMVEYTSVLKNDETPVMVMRFKNIPLAKYALPDSV